MAIVAGVDFGTLSVRVSVVDSERGSTTVIVHTHVRRETSCFLPRVGEFSRLKIQFAVALRAQARRRVQLWLAELPGVIS